MIEDLISSAGIVELFSQKVLRHGTTESAEISWKSSIDMEKEKKDYAGWPKWAKELDENGYKAMCLAWDNVARDDEKEIAQLIGVCIVSSYPFFLKLNDGRVIIRKYISKAPEKVKRIKSWCDIFEILKSKNYANGSDAFDSPGKTSFFYVMIRYCGKKIFDVPCYDWDDEWIEEVYE